MREFNYGPPMAEYGRNHEERLRKKRQFKFKLFGGGGASPFDPSKIPGLVAWYRFNRGITSSVNLISQWDDASGNGHHLKQTAGGSQPLMQSDGSMIFDGATDLMVTTAFTFNQPCTYYLLFKQITWTSGDVICTGNGSGLGMIAQNPLTPQLRLNSGTAVDPGIGPTIGSYAAVCVVFNGASSLIQINNTTSSLVDTGANNPAGFTLGATPVPSGFSNIQVKEVALFNTAHDAPTRQTMINYMAAVGGLSI